MATTIATDDDAPEHDEVLGTEGAAAYLAISLPTLMDLIRSGQLKAARVGRQWRIRRSWIDAFLENAAAAV
ncbi:MAG TPA: helix-turn-helix domain-containing protein [Vicinamibacterales bacterium]|nr:helix-turn-helix domain-containing protein [Vicinamibacterales bacterium]